MQAWRVGTATIAAVLGGCANPPVDLTRTFEEGDFRWAEGPGMATLTGQAFARTNGGEVRACAGLEIYLVPVTPYTKAISKAIQDGNRRFVPHPPAYLKYRRSTLGDVSGGFEFRELPAGQWYVGCQLSIMTSCSGWSCNYDTARIERLGLPIREIFKSTRRWRLMSGCASSHSIFART